MKKLIVSMLVTLMLYTAITGCIQQTDVPPEMSAQQEEQMQTPTIAPTPTSEVTPKPLSEWERECIKRDEERTKLGETYGFPIIPRDAESYEDLIALLGKPDKEITTKDPKTPAYEEIDLFYSKYNRVFQVGIWHEYKRSAIFDTTYKYIIIDKLALGMTEKQVKKILGNPTSKSEVDQGEELFSQYWDYDNLDMRIIFWSDSKSMKNAEVGHFGVGKKYKGKTSCGIGIGSTREEVISKYCFGIYCADEIYGDSILIGDEGAGIDFRFEDEKLVNIWIGTRDDFG